MRKKIYWAVLAIVALAGIGYYYNTAATTVGTTKVGRGNIQHTIVDTGYVQSSDKIDFYSQQIARVASLPVEVGQSVAKGQVLMTLDSTDLAMSTDQIQIQLSQAQAAAASAEAALARGEIDLKNAETNLDRIQQLFNAGAVSQADLDAAQTQMAKFQQNQMEQKQNLETARRQIVSYQNLLANSQQKQSQLVVISTIDGTLMQLPVQIGQVISPGILLATVAQPDQLEIKADLLSDDLGQIKVGQKVFISAPVLGNEIINGEIQKIYPQAEEKQSALGVVQRRVPVIIALNSVGNLKPGYETRVSIITSYRENVLLVPRQAVITANTGEKQVMTVVNGRVAIKSVQTGTFDSQNIEITSGLDEGNIIITDASTVLPEKTRVKASQ